MVMHACSCRENVVKECQEEASIPAELAARATPAGAVSYTSLQASKPAGPFLLFTDDDAPYELPARHACAPGFYPVNWGINGHAAELAAPAWHACPCAFFLSA
jgi:hypothetical protein